MNKLLKSIVTATVGVAMAIGVGVGLGREANVVYAADSEVTWTDATAFSATATSVANHPDITFKTSSENNYTAPLRVYANTTITIAALNGAKIKSVTYAASSTGNYVTYAQNATVTPSVTPTVSGKNVTWTLDSVGEFTFKPGTQTRTNGITVVYSPAPTSDPAFTIDKTAVNLVVGGPAVSVTATPNENVDQNATYSWERTSGADCIVLENENTPTVTISAKSNADSGNCVVTASVTDCTSKNVTVNVTKPLTVVEARDAIDDAGSSSIPNSYVKGIISQIDSLNETYHSITYWISDDGSTSNQLEVYSGKGLFGADFSAATDIKVGAEVIICGTLKKYGSTYEFDMNNYQVSYVAPVQPDVPEPTVETKTIAEFLALDNTKARAYSVTGTIKSWENDTKNESGHFTLTDGTNDLVIYGATANANELVWDNVSSYIFSNPKDFLVNEVTASIKIGDTVTMKLIRDDYHETKEGKGIITDVQHVQIVLTDITMSSSTLTLIVGQSSDLSVSPVPQNAELGTVAWSSSNEDVATVENGTVTALSSGTATITATAGGFSKTCALTVNAAPKTAIEEKGPFVKVTDTSGLLPGAQYLIAYEDGNLVFDGKLGGEDNPLDAVGNYSSTSSLKNIKDSFFTIAAVDGGFSLKSNSGYYIGETSDANGLLSSSETVFTNTITFEENGNVNIISSGGAYLRYNSASNQTRFRYYKSSSYTGQKAIQLYRFLTSPAISIATLRGTESIVDGNVVVDSLDLRFGIKIKKSYWNSIAANGWTIQDYGVMMFRTTEAKLETAPSVRERYEESASNVSIGHRESGLAPDEDGNGNYNFTVKVNIPNTSYYDYYICVRPFIKIGDEIIWLLGEDMQKSVRTMADGDNSGTNFTPEALNYLKTVQHNGGN